MITTDKDGQNEIVVVAGANGTFTPDRLAPAAALLRRASVVLLQLEVPIATVERAASAARSAGATLLLDPAPAADVSNQLLALTSLVTPNESELAVLAAAPMLDSPAPENEIDRRAQRLLARGAPAVVVKLGARGARLVTPTQRITWAAFPVNVVDTTAPATRSTAHWPSPLPRAPTVAAAIRFACAAGALSVTRPGAQPSMPTRDEVEHLMKRSEA